MIDTAHGRRRRTALRIATLAFVGSGSFVAACAARGPGTCCGEPATVVRLRPAVTPLGSRNGMSNLFFLPPTNERLPVGWDSAGVSPLTRISGRDVLVARGRVRGTWEYRVDRGQDGDFRDDPALSFESKAPFRVASIALRAGRARATTVVHLLEGSDGNVYGRAASEWHGVLRTSRGPVALRLRPESRMAPLPALGDPIELVADLDGDGSFRSRGEVDRTGRPLLSERVDPTRPFRMGEDALRVGALDLAAGRLVLAPLPARQAALAPGFLAPPLVTSLMDGRQVALADLRGRATVLTFWSVHCPFSEAVRPEILRLAERFGDRVSWVAIARETDGGTVGAHLADHPMAGTPWQNDSTIWQQFNPETVTPLFYILDAAGEVVAVERGASAAPLIEAVLSDLLVRSAAGVARERLGTDR